jgi:hypothetical protein
MLIGEYMIAKNAGCSVFSLASVERKLVLIPITGLR